MVSWEDFAIAVGGFTPVIAVGAVIAAQELSRLGSFVGGSGRWEESGPIPEEAEMIEEWKSIIRDLTGRLPPELKIETKRGGWTATYYPPDTIRFRPDVWKKLTLDEKRLTVLHELFHYFDIPKRVDLRHFEFNPVVDIVLRKLGYPIPEEYQRKAEKIIRILRGG